MSTIALTTATEAARTSGIKAMIYGAPGVGKTTLCATAPRPLVVSCEAGLLPLRGRPDIPVATIKTVDDLGGVFDWLQTPQARENIATICLDSVTEIAEVVLANARTQTRDPRQAYNEVIVQMTATIRAFRDLAGYHVLMLAQEEPIRDDTGMVKAGPSMPGSKLSNKVPYFLDILGRLAVGTDKDGGLYRYIQTGPTPQAHGKDRSGALDLWEPADFGAIVAKIQGAVVPEAPRSV